MNAYQMLDAAPLLRNAQKRAMAGIILDEFKAARIPAGLALAAVANAIRESGLDPNASGDNGHSIGLFQINDLGGRIEYDFDRTDPRANTQHIIRELFRMWAKDGKIGRYQAERSMKDAYENGATVPEMAALFAAIVERPKDIPKEMEASERIAREQFPEVTVRKARSIAYSSTDILIPPRSGIDNRAVFYWWASILGSSALIAALLWRRSRR
jgi:hypothetical protein